MTDTDYDQIFRNAFTTFLRLKKQREEITAELDRLKQFLYATSNMLSDGLRKEVKEDLALILQTEEAQNASLVEAVRKVLTDSPARYFTVREMRDALKESGFDFSQYTANPLASISTTLKRLKSKDVVVTEIEGVTAYRRKPELNRHAVLAKKLG